MPRIVWGLLIPKKTPLLNHKYFHKNLDFSVINLNFVAQTKRDIRD